MITVDDKRVNRDLNKLLKKFKRVEQNLDGKKSKEMLKSHREIGKFTSKRRRAISRTTTRTPLSRRKARSTPLCAVS